VSYTIRPLTPDLWPALEDLFGKHGASNGCWCMYWRIGAEYNKRPRSENRADFCMLVENGPPPGLLAFDGELAVGWCQLTPRAALPWLNLDRRLKAVDDVPVWSISCFYIRRGYRRKGVATALIAAALDAARAARAPALEAYPIDSSVLRSEGFTGFKSTFQRAGFKVVGQHVPGRPIMRYDFGR
jgi:GNAT superfamily N-acetyltransferase